MLGDYDYNRELFLYAGTYFRTPVQRKDFSIESVFLSGLLRIAIKRPEKKTPSIEKSFVNGGVDFR